MWAAGFGPPNASEREKTLSLDACCLLEERLAACVLARECEELLWRRVVRRLVCVQAALGARYERQRANFSPARSSEPATLCPVTTAAQSAGDRGQGAHNDGPSRSCRSRAPQPAPRTPTLLVSKNDIEGIDELRAAARHACDRDGARRAEQAMRT